MLEERVVHGIHWRQRSTTHDATARGATVAAADLQQVCARVHKDKVAVACDGAALVCKAKGLVQPACGVSGEGGTRFRHSMKTKAPDFTSIRTGQSSKWNDVGGGGRRCTGLGQRGHARGKGVGLRGGQQAAQNLGGASMSRGV